MEKKRILIIDNDEYTRNQLIEHIGSIGFELEFADSGDEGLSLALSEDFALVLLSLGIPGLQGLEVCRGIRKVKEILPIIMLSKHSEEIDRIIGLELGADDYIVKPFSIFELRARIKARLRHSLRMSSPSGFEVNHQRSADTVLRYCELELDTSRRRVIMDGKQVTLTAREFDLLCLLARNPGKAFSREELLKMVWGVSAKGYENNVNSLVTRLRKKLEVNQSDPKFLKTVWGVGYRFISEEEI